MDMRTDVLAHGQFFGDLVAEQRAGGFVVTLNDYGRGTAIPWHRHSEPCVTFVVAGAYRERLQRSTRECTARTLVLHEADELHADDFLAPSRCLGIYFDPRRIGMAFDRIGTVRSPALAAIATHAARELRRRDSVTPLVIEGLMLQMFGELSRADGGAIAPWLGRVRDEIASRFAEPLTHAALAANAGVHPVHLARSFRRYFGITVGEMIRQLRVEHAKSAIRGGRPLAAAALEAGFADQSHLTRTFRAVTGLTPGAFRRANRVPRS